MSLDWTTEILSHFIGLFEIGEERARLRDDYDRFKHNQNKRADEEIRPAEMIKLKAPYKLENFTPKIKYSPMDPADIKAGPYFPNIFMVEVHPIWPFLSLPVFDVIYPIGFGQGFQTNYIYEDVLPDMELDPAGSVATVTFQFNYLTDNDVLLGEGQVAFVPTDIFMVQLDTLVALAEGLQTFDTGTLFNADISATEIAQAWHATVQQAQTDDALPNTPTTNTPDAATVAVQFGDDVTGIYVNGEKVDEMPDISDLLPDRLKVGEDAGQGTVVANGEAEAADGVSGIEGEGTTTVGSSEGGEPSPHEVPDGHNVVMGGNFLINETNVAMNWLDAPTIAVMGDVYAVNAISQVNVVSDRDTGLDSTTDKVTETLNLSQVSHISNPFTPADGPLPEYWVVATLEADVVSANWVEQFNFAADNDIAEVHLSGQDSFLRLGDNTLVNTNMLTEIGYGYDLIIIGGSIININAISQTNVLLDNDDITAAGGTPGTVNGSGNVVANVASINAVGVDSYSAMSEGIANAFDQIEEGFGRVHDALAGLDLVNGVEVLRVLHITGDLIQMNLIKQTNILGDADQVHLALEEFLGEHGDISVNTGENALLNAASVATYGIDSDVYVGGEVYSDALLVQADLIDTDADPLGVNLAGGDLANEAVAFLADDMIPDTDPEQGLDPNIVATTGEESTTTSDSLQVMLA